MAASLSIPLNPWLDSSHTRAVFTALEQGGGEARFVGGCVRDAVLERPVTDFDVACTLPPEKTLALLEAVGIRAIPTGIDHGTVTAIFDETKYEITTLRRDVAPDGRHTEVEFTDDWQEDAARRDFTMNALYASRDGTIHDYTGGVEDALYGRIRFIGDPLLRIEEDGLRILRYFRFYAHYGTPPFDPVSIAACEAKADMIDQLSGERIQAEMLKLLAASHPADILGEMQRRNVLGKLCLITETPVLAALEMLAQVESEAGKVVDSLRRLALVVRADKDPGEKRGEISRRWKLSGKQQAILTELVEKEQALVADWNEKQIMRMIRHTKPERFADKVLLAWAEYLAAFPAEQKNARDNFAPIIWFAENWEVPQFPLQGRDLLALGVPEGPKIGALLSELESFWEAADYRADKSALLAEASARLRP